MTLRQFHKAMSMLNHAIDSLGPTKPCFLLVVDGRMQTLPATHNDAEVARSVLVRAMLDLVKEQP